MTHTETSFLRQGKTNEVSSFFWAIPIKPPLVTINATEYWAKQPSFNICVWYQHGHRFYNRECSKQEIHNSIKTGTIQKLCSLMERKDSYCLGTAQSRGLICAASKPLQITIPSMLPPGSCAQQYSSGIHQQHGAASSCPSVAQEGGAGAPPSPAAEQGLPHGSCTAPHPQPWARWRGSMEWTASPAHRFVIKQQETKSRCCKE